MTDENTPATAGFREGQQVQVISAYSTNSWPGEILLMNDKLAVVQYTENGKIEVFVFDPISDLLCEQSDDEETPVRYISVPGSEYEREVLERIKKNWSGAKVVRLDP